MLHEILFALLGKSGNIIIEKEDKFELQGDLKFLNSSEKQIINEICILGFYFKQIETFLEENYTSFQKLSILEKQFQKQANLDEKNISPQDEDEVEQIQDTVIGNSAYLKAFCFGCEEILDEYREVIISIEKKFLEDRIFTVSNLRYRLSKYLEILPDLHNTISKIINNSIKGGQLIDLVFKKSQSGNRNLRDIYQKLCNQVYQVLHQQLSGWLLYGKLQDFYDEFFIYKLDKKTSEEKQEQKLTSYNNQNKKKEKQNDDLIYDWDQMFSIRIQQLPASFISIKQAEKILFIGKGMKVLRKQLDLYDTNQSFLPEPSILQIVGSLEEYDAFQFQNILEKLRYHIASKLLKLVIIQQNLKDHLYIMKKYFLLNDGEFYQVFQDECRVLMQDKPEAKSQNILNNQILPTVFQKLRIDEHELIHNFSFNIKSNSFEYENFKNIQKLNIIGNVQQSRNHYLRLNPMKTTKQAASVWYSFKQTIQSGFNLKFAFRFKKERNSQFAGIFNSPTKSSLQQNFGGVKNSIDLSSAKKHQESNLQSPFQQNFNFSQQQNYQLSASKFYTNAKQFQQQQQQQQQQSQNQFCLCFQSQKEISTHKRSAPLYLKELSDYFTIKFGVDELQKGNSQNGSVKENYTSCYIHICKFSANMQKEELIKEFKFDIEKVNFIEENVQDVEIKFKDKQLKLVLSGLENRLNKIELEQQMSFSMNVSDIQELVKLDMGKCYIGFMNNSVNANCSIDLLNMNFYGSNPFNKDDPWNGLTLDYDVKWPLNLILSQTVMEQYRTLFRYFFPFRQAKVQLHRVWLYLIKKLKSQRNLSRLEKQQLYLRNQMSIIIEGFWQYFQIDVIQHSWQQISDKINKIDDFEELRNILEKHLEGIMQKVFLSYHSVLQTIFQIISHTKTFDNLIMNQDDEDVFIDKDNLIQQFDEIQTNFENDIENLLHQLNQMNKNSNSTFLYQLIVRLDMNKYYDEKMIML